MEFDFQIAQLYYFFIYIYYTTLIVEITLPTFCNQIC